MRRMRCNRRVTRRKSYSRKVMRGRMQIRMRGRSLRGRRRIRMRGRPIRMRRRMSLRRRMGSWGAGQGLCRKSISEAPLSFRIDPYLLRTDRLLNQRDYGNLSQLFSSVLFKLTIETNNLREIILAGGGRS
jgi:hypothetical protein